MQGSFARISYLCIDHSVRGQQIGAQLLAVTEAFAKAQGCDRMELYCDQRRGLAHKFYLRQSDVDAPQYFRKNLS